MVISIMSKATGARQLREPAPDSSSAASDEKIFFPRSGKAWPFDRFPEHSGSDDILITESDGVFERPDNLGRA